MKTLKQIERLRKAHELIKQEKTGVPKDFAKKLHVSEREVYRVLEYLKEIDAEISFSNNLQSYYYSNEFDLLVHVSVKVIKNESTKTIYGGCMLLNDNFQNKKLAYYTDWLCQ